MNMQYYIYKVTNSINGKCYIGQHKVPSKPENFRRYLGTGIAIREAIKKYGKNVFNKEILEYIDDDEKHIKVSEREIYYIKLYNSRVPNGYNISPGGEGGATKESGRKGALTRKLRGYNMTDETKHKISVANAGKPKSEIHKKHLSDHHRNKQNHTIVFEDGSLPEVTNDSTRKIASRYGVAERSLIRASMKNIFINGVKITEYYDPLWELYWQINQYGLFRDPINHKLKSYTSMWRSVNSHLKRDHVYDNIDVWDLFETFNQDYLCKKHITISEISKLKNSELYQRLHSFRHK